MASGEEEQVTKAVMDYLRTADMDVTTERIVLNHVQDTLTLSKPISKYKRLVSSTIDTFLEELDAQKAEADGGGDKDSGGADEPEAGAGGKSGRKRAAAGAGSGPSKRSRVSDEGEVLFSKDLSSRRKARVRCLEGKVQVDVRQFWQADGCELPSRTGLAMDPGEWARLRRDLPQLVAAQREHNTAAPACQISKGRRATISEFNGIYYLGLREWYDMNGQLRPSKDGISLTLVEAEALLAAANDITEAAGDVEELPPPDAESGAAGGISDVQSKEVVELGNQKRMSIIRFQGQLCVNMRQYFETNGQLLPCKKGILLSNADWAKLYAHRANVDLAQKRKDMGYFLQLSGLRQVKISEFMGVTYVGVREYYNKGGQLAPSQKGISLNPAQWAAFMAGAPVITAALKRAHAGR